MMPATRRRQAGATIVEFALALLTFLMFTLGLLDFARLLHTWNAASEVTRLGARFAVACADTGNGDLVLARMRGLLPQVSAIDVAWAPAGCSAATCESVTVSITGLSFNWIAPVPGSVGDRIIAMPGFSTYLPREMMRQDPLSAADC
jgi:Flp pilus assembly protein TadG